MTGRRAAPFLAALAAFLLHLPALRNDFVFDDRGVLLQNPLLADVRSAPRLLSAPYWNAPGLTGGLYRPATTLTFALDRALAGGFRSSWFHATNILWHAVVTGLLVLLAMQLALPLWAALLAGLLFAVHPVHVEAIAGVVGRAELIAAAGILAALLCAAQARRRDGRPGTLAAAGAIVFGLIALLAKESAFVLPAIVWLYDRAFPAPRPLRGRTLMIGGIAVLALALGLRAHALGGFGSAPIPFVDNPAASAGPVLGRIAALSVVPRMARLLVWPHPLSADYSYAQLPVPPGAFNPGVLLGTLIALGVVAAGVLALRRRPALGFSLLLIPVSLLLTCNLIVFIGTLLAERLLYLPSAGVCLAAAVLAADAASGRGAARRGLRAGVVALVAGALALGAWLSVARLADWRDDFSLYSSAAQVSPKSTRIRYNLGNAWLRRGRFREAEAEYREALAIYPEFADARGNLGLALLQQGRAKEALGPLEEAARRQPKNPEVRVNLGSARRVLGDPTGARREFEAAIALSDNAASAWNDLGSLLLAQGETDEAIRCLQRAAQAEPQYALYRVNLADAYNAAGRRDEARAQFEAASSLDPEAPEAMRGRGELLLERGDAAGAEKAFRAAVAGTPPSPRAANFLGYLLARRGDRAGAIEAYEKAVALDPTLWDAHKSLGLIYSGQASDRLRAIEHLRASLLLEPGQEGAADLRARLGTLESGGTGAAPGGGR
ncbi:MAG TPA: tetratricopeptide repeat protein [Verrucomicrobiae bacterium]|nr:tetratricopeptide repeat protein [Verrucomicrobiae bacterium]